MGTSTDLYHINMCSSFVGLGFLGGSVLKNLPANAGDADLIPGLARFPREGNRIHSSILAWKIPWTEVSGGLQSMGLQRVQHDFVTKQQQDFPGGSVVKNPPANEGDTGSIPDPGRSHMPWSNYAHMLQPSKPTRPRACALQQDKSRQWAARAPQKKPTKQSRPSTAKLNL